eukprot:5663641-Prymnesium_polylepis.1
MFERLEDPAVARQLDPCGVCVRCVAPSVSAGSARVRGAAEGGPPRWTHARELSHAARMARCVGMPAECFDKVGGEEEREFTTL